MKKQLLSGILLCICIATQAQSSHSVNFNTYVSGTNNDLTNNFNGSFSMTQQTTNGITGGSVLPSPTLVYNKAVYNGKCYVSKSDADSTSVSISFKYSASGASSGDGGPEVGFKVGTDSTGAIVGGFVTVNISDYPFGGSMFNVDGAVDHYGSASFNLVDGHWYQLKLSIHAINPDSVTASSYVYELGAAGTSTPVLVSSFLNNIEGITGITWPRSYILATFNGGLSGGVVYMDNFNLNSFAFPSGIATVDLQKDMYISNPVTNTLFVTTTDKSEVLYAIYNTAGASIKTGTISGSTGIDVSGLPSSLYLIRFTSAGKSVVLKFIKE